MDKRTGRTLYDLFVEKPIWVVIGFLFLIGIFIILSNSGYHFSINGISIERDTTQHSDTTKHASDIIQPASPKMIDSISSALDYFRMAMGLKDYYRRIEFLDSAIQLNPTAKYYYYIGQTKMKIFDYEGAVKDLNQSVLLDSLNPYAYDHLGLAKLELCRPSNTKELCWEAIKDFERAISLFEDVKNDNVNVSTAYYNQGLSYKEIKEFCIALDKVKLAIKSRRHRVYEEEIIQLRSLCKK